MNDSIAAAIAAAFIALSAQCSFPWQGAEPFAAQPDVGEGLVNVSADLLEVLENGTLPGSCDAYWDAVDAGTATTRMRLLCGKELFFFGSFDMPGIPQTLAQYLADNYPEVGEGFSALGMIPDPTHPDRLPLGLVPSVELAPGIPSLAFGCASCHFGQLPDGRYAVGAPNHDYDYGQLLVVNTIFPFEALRFGNDGFAPEAVAAVASMVERFNADPAEPQRLLGIVFPLASIPGGAPPTTPDQHRAWVSWKPGTQDFLMAPAPEDGIHTISKISPIWGIPDGAEVAAAGMPNALLAWTGVATDLQNFVEGFVAAFDADLDTWTPDRLAPLADYVYTLRAPENPNPPDPAAVAEGARLFEEAGCIACHYGPRGSGTRYYDYEEIGTDPEMKYWMDPDRSGDDPELTYALKSPRLVGMWTQKVFLHNGSVDSLEDLFCLNGDRPTIPLSEAPYSDAGHDFTCNESLSVADRENLIAFLLSH